MREGRRTVPPHTMPNPTLIGHTLAMNQDSDDSGIMVCVLHRMNDSQQVLATAQWIKQWSGYPE